MKPKERVPLEYDQGAFTRIIDGIVNKMRGVESKSERALSHLSRRVSEVENSTSQVLRSVREKGERNESLPLCENLSVEGWRRLVFAHFDRHSLIESRGVWRYEWQISTESDFPNDETKTKRKYTRSNNMIVWGTIGSVHYVRVRAVRRDMQVGQWSSVESTSPLNDSVDSTPPEWNSGGPDLQFVSANYTWKFLRLGKAVLSWIQASDDSGMGGYIVRYRVKGGDDTRWSYRHFDHWAVHKDSIRCYGTVKPLIIGKTYQFQITAYDKYGNVMDDGLGGTLWSSTLEVAITDSTPAPVVSGIVNLTGSDFHGTDSEIGLAKSFVSVGIEQDVVNNYDLYMATIRFRKQGHLLWLRHKTFLLDDLDTTVQDSVTYLVMKLDNLLPDRTYEYQVKVTNYGLQSSGWSSTYTVSTDELSVLDMRDDSSGGDIVDGSFTAYVYPVRRGWWKRLEYHIHLEFGVKGTTSGVANRYEIITGREVTIGGITKFIRRRRIVWNPTTAGETEDLDFKLDWRPPVEYQDDDTVQSGVYLNIRAWYAGKPGNNRTGASNFYSSDKTDYWNVHFGSPPQEETAAVPNVTVTPLFSRFIKVSIPVDYNFPDNFHCFTVHADFDAGNSGLDWTPLCLSDPDDRRDQIGEAGKFRAGDRNIVLRVPWILYDHHNGQKAFVGPLRLDEVTYKVVAHTITIDGSGYMRPSVTSVTSAKTSVSGSFDTDDHPLDNPFTPVRQVGVYGGDLILAPSVRVVRGWTSMAESPITRNAMDNGVAGNLILNEGDIVVLAKSGRFFADASPEYYKVSSGTDHNTVVLERQFKDINGNPTPKESASPGNVLVKIGEASSSPTIYKIYRFLWFDAKNDYFKVYEVHCSSEQIHAFRTVAKFGTDTLTSYLAAGHIETEEGLWDGSSPTANSGKGPGVAITEKGIVAFNHLDKPSWWVVADSCRGTPGRKGVIIHTPQGSTADLDDLEDRLDELEDDYAVIYDTVSTLNSVIKVRGDGDWVGIGTDSTDRIRIGNRNNTSSIDLLTDDAKITLEDGTIELKADGNIELDGGSIDIKSDSSIDIDAGSTLKLDGGSISIGSVSTTDLTLEGNTLTLDANILTLKGVNEFNFNTGSQLHIYNDGQLTIGNTTAEPSFTFDVSNSEFIVGSGSDSIKMKGDNGDNSYIMSGNFQSGLVPGQGKGFKLSADGNLEANNAYIRGALKSSAFIYDEISAIGGKFFVSKCATLKEAISDTDTTITVDHDPGFSVGEFLVIKEGTQIEYMKVTTDNGSGNYSVDREIPLDATIDPISFYTECDDLTGWSTTGTVTQTTFDSRSTFKVESDSTTNKDLGTVPTGKFAIRLVVYNDSVGSSTSGSSMEVIVRRSDIMIRFLLNTDKMRINSDAGVLEDVNLTTPQGKWTTILLDVDATTPSTATCDVYKNGELVASDVDCSYDVAGTDGLCWMNVLGTGVAYYDLLQVGKIHSSGKFSWEEGTAVVSYGKDVNNGFALMDSESSYSPYIDILFRSSSTFPEDYETKARLGRLDGINDSDFSIGSGEFGLYTDNCYLKGKLVISDDEGIRVKDGGDIRIDQTGVAKGISWYDSADTRKASILYDGSMKIQQNVSGQELWINFYHIYMEGGRCDMSYLTGPLFLPTLSSDPSPVQEGAMYVNTSSHQLKVYLNGSWRVVQTS